MSRDAIVHFGLHKTATSTAEATLRSNASGSLLADRIIVVGRKDWPEVSDAAKRYSDDRTPDRLAAFGAALAARLGALPDDGRSLLFANVDLSGRLPSHPAVDDYAAVPELAGETARRLDATPGIGRITFVASTRAPDRWLASLYWQSLKVLRETRDVDAFAKAHAALADFAPLLQRVAEAIAPAELVTTRLEDSAGTPAGPATPLLAAAGFSAGEIARVTPHRRLKPSPPKEVRDALLELNRSELDDEALDDAKAALIAIAGGIV